MYAGISGMNNFQTKLDVIGNNISNVNTAGFKKGRVTFQDMMSQTTSGAQAATDTRGGVNPAQVGLGSQLGSIDNIHTQGFRETTDNPLDLALEGDGMFVVQDDDFTAYTRAGNFYLDVNGDIVNQDGYYLMGYQANNIENGRIVESDSARISFDQDGELVELIYLNADGDEVDIDLEDVTLDATDENNIVITLADGETITIQTDEDSEDLTVQIGEASEDNTGDAATEYPLTTPEITNTVGRLTIPDHAESFNVETNGTITYVDDNGQTQVVGQVALANFSNPAGLQKAGSNLFLDSENAGYTGISIPETDGTASIVSGALEMSNVDLAEEFTEMITAQRGFQANTRIITTSDEILQELVNLKR